MQNSKLNIIVIGIIKYLAYNPYIHYSTYTPYLLSTKKGVPKDSLIMNFEFLILNYNCHYSHSMVAEGLGDIS